MIDVLQQPYYFTYFDYSSIIITSLFDDQAMQKTNSSDNAVGEDLAALSRQALQHFKGGRLQEAQDVDHIVCRSEECLIPSEYH